jgi:hypothetical protein
MLAAKPASSTVSHAPHVIMLLLLLLLLLLLSWLCLLA